MDGIYSDLGYLAVISCVGSAVVAWKSSFDIYYLFSSHFHDLNTFDLQKKMKIVPRMTRVEEKDEKILSAVVAFVSFGSV